MYAMSFMHLDFHPPISLQVLPLRAHRHILSEVTLVLLLCLHSNHNMDGVAHGSACIHICVLKGVKFSTEEDAPQFPANEVLVRDLLNVFVNTHMSLQQLGTSTGYCTRLCGRNMTQKPHIDRESQCNRIRSLCWTPVVRILTDFHNTNEIIEANAELKAHL